MMEKDEDITFDECTPNFGGMFKSEAITEVDYATLYDELAEKIRPDKYVDREHFDQRLFEDANRLYDELLKHKGASDNDLIPIRNKAIDTLGICISTKKKVDYLEQYLDPTLYTNVDEDKYDVNRALEAGRYYAQLQERRNDIRLLEALEVDASDFISKRKEELLAAETEEKAKEEIRRKDREREEQESFKQDVAMAIIAGVICLLAIIIVLILQ